MTLTGSTSAFFIRACGGTVRRLDRKQRDLLGDILSKIIVYLATIALVKQVLGKQLDLITLTIVIAILMVLIVGAIIVVREENE